MIFDIGPFQLYRVEKNGTLDITLRCIEDWECGWEYGWRDDARGPDKPLIEFRIGKLMVLYFQLFEDAYEVWFLGFWAFLKWRKRKKK